MKSTNLAGLAVNWLAQPSSIASTSAAPVLVARWAARFLWWSSAFVTRAVISMFGLAAMYSLYRSS